jgi:hypothetical protein
MNRQKTTKSRTNKTKNNKHPRRAGRDVARGPSSRPSPDADHPVPRSIVFLSIETSSRVPPVPSSSSRARARSKSHHPHAPQKKKRLVRERGALSTASNARAESAFAKMRSAWGIRLTVHNSRKWVWTFAFKAQSREIDRTRFAPSVSSSTRWIDRWNFHFDRVWTRFDRWKCPITGIDRWFLWFRFGFDGVANRSRRLIHDE